MSAGHLNQTLIALAIWICLGLTSALSAQSTEASAANEVETAGTNGAFTPASIQARIEQLEKDESIELETRSALTDVYKQLLTEMNSTQFLRKTNEEWKAKLESIPDDKTAAEVALDQLGVSAEEQPAQVAGADLDQKQLDDRVRSLQDELKKAETALSDLMPLEKRREDLRLQVPKKLADLDENRSELEKLKAAASASDASEPALLRQARQALIEAKLANNTLERQNIEGEQAYYDNADELLAAQVALAKAKVERLKKQATDWSNLAQRRRTEAAQRDVEAKQDKVSEVPKILQPLAEQNVKFAQDLKNLAVDIRNAAQKLNVAAEKKSRWVEQFKRVTELIDANSGVTESVGNLLREQRAELPNTAQLEREIDERHKLIYEIRSAEFTAGEELTRISADIDASITRELNSLEASHTIPAQQRESLKPQIRSLLQDREETLESLVENYKEYSLSLVNLNVAQEQLLKNSESYVKFIDERVLWIRSVRPVTWSDLKTLPEAFAWLTNADLRAALKPSNLVLSKRTVVLHFLIGILVVAGLYIRQTGLAKIQQFGERASARGCREFQVTAGAGLWTLLISITGPAVLAWVGWLVADLTHPTRISATLPLQSSLFAAALIYWPIALWWNATRTKGLAHAHFDWSEKFVLRLRQQLRWLMVTLVPTGAIYYFFSVQKSLVWDTSIARFSLVFAASCLTVWCYSLFSPKQGVTREYLFYEQSGWLYRLRYIWFPAIVALPVSLAILALMGYQYTSQRLLECLFMSVVFLSTLYLVSALALRWILVNRRELTMAQAKERLAQRGEAGEGGEFHGRVAEQVNLVEIDHQSRRLLNAIAWVVAALGVYLIWVDVLPALTRLNEVKLWPIDAVATQAAETGGNSSEQPTLAATAVGGESWVTLANLLGSLLILMMMWIAIRNIPGLLEFAVLQKLPLDASLRFAITTVVRYCLIVVGVGWALGNIGFGWSKIQWLAAAISVGLGFGLQEIFANFISGLILLFERPLRAGDIVTVGDVTGTVVEIKTRATTIQDWDRKELVVPNREFITGRLLNWTLTDQINRVVIQIGVAYGTDIEAARNLVLETARANEEILEDPAPSVVFDLFGDSALNLTLRCYLPDMSNRLNVMHELHREIYNALNKAGITIPFPQRDVHLNYPVDSDDHRASTKPQLGIANPDCPSDTGDLGGSGNPDTT